MGTKYTLTGDLGAQVGEHRYTGAYIVTNLPNGVPLVDTTATTDGINIGTVPVDIGTNGTFSVSLLGTANTGLNVAANTLQYRMHCTYVDAGDKQRKQFDSGWFALTANADLRTLIDTAEAIAAAGGLEQRIDGVTDHGNVSGSLELDSDTSTHWLDASGPLVLSFTDGPTGGTRYVSVLVVSGAEDVTVADLPDVTFTDATFATFAWVRGAWMLAAAGGGEPTDTTPPTDITDLNATGGSGQITLTGTNPTDADSTARIKYRVWLTSGGATGSYLTANSFPIVVTGLTGGAYTVQAYSYSNGGQQTTPDSATATVTTPPGWVEFDHHDFTAADGTLLSAVPTANGSTYFTGGNSKIYGNAATNAVGSGSSDSNGLFVTGSTNTREVYTYDVTRNNAGTYGSLMVIFGSSLGAFYCQIKGGASTATLNTFEDYFGDVAPTFTLESGQSLSGHPLTGELATVKNAASDTVGVWINDVKIGTFTVAGSLEADQVKFRTKNEGRVDRHLIQIYSA